MKNYILLGSVGTAGLATILGITGVLYQGGSFDAAIFSMKMYQIAAMFGLLSITSFFVGWVFPGTVVSTQEYNPETRTTKEVKNG